MAMEASTKQILRIMVAGWGRGWVVVFCGQVGWMVFELVKRWRRSEKGLLWLCGCRRCRK